MYFFAQLINLFLCCCLLLIVILFIGVLSITLIRKNAIANKDKQKGTIPNSKSEKPAFEEAEYREVK